LKSYHHFDHQLFFKKSIINHSIGNVLGVIELERITRKRYMDLSQECDKHSNDTQERLAYAIRQLKVAFKHLNDVTFSETNKNMYQHECPSIVNII
jgi:hypothetical protein